LPNSGSVILAGFVNLSQTVLPGAALGPGGMARMALLHRLTTHISSLFSPSFT
jgi:hypothetical protein